MPFSPQFPSRRRFRVALRLRDRAASTPSLHPLLFGVAAAIVCAACVTPVSWHPAPPAGATYRYDDQGFRASKTTVVAISGRHAGYVGAFGFRGKSGIKHEGEAAKDPFEQSAPIDGVRFNEHLDGQGAMLQPASGATGALPTTGHATFDAVVPEAAPPPASSADPTGGNR